MPGRPTTESTWSLLSEDLRRFIRRRVPDEHAAEDLLQDTFVRVHRGLPQLRGDDRLAAWVHRIARNAIRDHYRTLQTGAERLDEDSVPEAEEDPVSELRIEASGWLGSMIRSLPNGYRDALQLAEIDGRTQQEVADRLGLSLPGAKSRVQRGRALLKRLLDDCCHFEVDVRGNVMSYRPRAACAPCASGQEPGAAGESECGFP